MSDIYNTGWMRVRSGNPSDKEKFNQVLAAVENDLLYYYELKAVTECNGEIFFFLINDEEVKNSRTTPAYFPLPTKA
ncbi:MAG TPA: hypothetical protein VF233_07465 [Nitrososphaeraceae archaeon]